MSSDLDALRADADAAVARFLGKEDGVPGVAPDAPDPTKFGISLVNGLGADPNARKRMKEINPQKLVAEGPTTAKTFSEPKRVREASDDIENMWMIERVWRETGARLGQGEESRQLGKLLWEQMNSDEDDNVREYQIRQLQESMENRQVDFGVPDMGAKWDSAGGVLSNVKGFLLNAPGVTAEALPHMGESVLAGVEGRAVGMFGGLAGGTPASVAAGGATGGLLALLYATMRAEGGHAFGELRDITMANGEKIDRNAARALAFGVGGINAAFESFGIKMIPGMGALVGKFSRQGAKEVLSKPIFRSILFAATKQMGVEGATEFSQEATAVAAARIAIEIIGGKSIEEFTYEVEDPETGERVTLRGTDAMWARVIDAGIGGAQMGLMMGGGGKVSQLVRSSQAVQKAEQGVRKLANLRDRTAKSTLLETDPEAFKQHIRESSDRASVYIKPEALMEALAEVNEETRNEIERSVPSIRDQMLEIEESGGDFVIPMEDYLAHIALSDLGEAVAEHTTLDPQDMTKAEVEVFRETMAEEMESAIAEDGQREGSSQSIAELRKDWEEAQVSAQLQSTFEGLATEDQVVFDQSVESVRQTFAQQIEESGRYEAEDVGKQAAIAEEVYRNLALVMTNTQGRMVTPEEALQKFPLEVLGPDQEALDEPDVLNQPENIEPENASDHLLLVQREARVLGTEVVWIKGEQSRIKTNAIALAKTLYGKKPTPEQVSEVQATIEAYVAQEKLRHPISEGWMPWVYDKSKPKVDDEKKPKRNKKTGEIIFEHLPKNQAYTFDRDEAGKTGLKGKARDVAVQSLAQKTHAEIRKVWARAKAGDPTAILHLRQADWYRAMRARIRREFGGLGDLFADLLGGTSPQTPVRSNWENATEALSMATTGEWDGLIVEWEQWVEEYEAAEAVFLEWIAEKNSGKAGSGKMTMAALKEDGQYKAFLAEMRELRALPDRLNPRKRNGKKFGANGKQIVKTMVNLWRTIRKPNAMVSRGSTAPKAQNFSGNLIGYRQRATIDVWAARFLQRLRWGTKIPSKAEGGVGGDAKPDGSTTGQFAFGQDVFSEAVKLIRADEDLQSVPELQNLNDDDLQAVVWFVEKEIWTLADATTGEGEGGSFEFEADLAGSTQFERIDELRRIATAKGSSLEEKKAAAHELGLIERTVDRFTAGFSLETGAWLQGVDYVPTDGEMAIVSARVNEAIHSTDPENLLVVGAKTMSTVGLYGGVERSFDVEVVAREGYDFNAFRESVFREAKASRQDSAFVSRGLRQDEAVDYTRHRPGIEVYFRESKPMSEIGPLLEQLSNILPTGYTVSVDARRTGAAVAGEMPSVVGIRAQYIPEFDVRWGDNRALAGYTEEELAIHMKAQGDAMALKVDTILADVEGVSYAGRLWHETEVRFEGDYDADTTGRDRADDQDAGGEGFGRSIAAGIEDAARRTFEVEAAEAEGRTPFSGDAFEVEQPLQQPAAALRVRAAAVSVTLPDGEKRTFRGSWHGEAYEKAREALGEAIDDPQTEVDDGLFELTDGSIITDTEAMRMFPDVGQGLPRPPNYSPNATRPRESISAEEFDIAGHPLMEVGTPDAGEVLEQPAGEATSQKPEARAEYWRTAQSAYIRLLRDADPTSFGHEMAHFYLDTMASMAEMGLADEQMQADLKTAMEFMDITDISQARQPYADGRLNPKGEVDKPHEVFARGFERFMAEGVAPSKRLAGVFARFRDWAMRTYKSVERVAQALGVELNPEIREVYGRMFDRGGEATETLFQPFNENALGPARVSSNRAQHLAEQKRAGEIGSVGVVPENPRILGVYNSDTQAINIDPDLPDFTRRWTVFHEQGHHAFMNLPEAEWKGFYDWYNRTPWDSQYKRMNAKGYTYEEADEFIADAYADPDIMLRGKMMVELDPNIGTGLEEIDVPPELKRVLEAMDNITGLWAKRRARAAKKERGGAEENLFQPSNEEDAAAAQDAARAEVGKSISDMRKGKSRADKGLNPRPMQSLLRDLGGVDPTSQLGIELLRAVPRHGKGSMRGLYVEGGIPEADQVIANESQLLLDVFGDRELTNDDLVEAVISEVQGDPIRSETESVAIAEESENKVAIQRAMDAAGLNFESMTDQEILNALFPVDPELDMETGEPVGEPILSENLIAEERELSETAGVAPTPWRQAKLDAEQMILDSKVRNLQPHRFRVQAAKQGRLALAAAQRGDIAQAQVHKRKQLLNAFLEQGARKMAKEARAATDFASGIQKKERRARLAKAGEDFLEVSDGLLARVDLKIGTTLREMDQRKSMREWIYEQEAQGESVIVPDKFRDELFKQNWRELTVQELLDLKASLQNIETLARRKVEIVSEGKTREINEVSEELAEAALDNVPMIPDSPNWNKTEMEQLKHTLMSMESVAIKLEFVIDRLDGHKPNGPWRRHLMQPAADMEARRNDLNREYTMKFAALVDGLMKGREKEYNSKSLTRYVALGGKNFTKGDLLMMGFNMMNESNMRKMLEGVGWTETQVMGVLDPVLEKRDWQFIQDTVDLLETLWPAIEAQEVELNGNVPAKVQAREVVTRHGTFKGGYFPVVYDPDKARWAFKHAEHDLYKDMETHFQRPITGHGHTHERTSVVGPLLLDLSVLPSHLDQVIHDLSHRAGLMQMYKLVNNDIVMDALEKTIGPEQAKLFHPWLEAQAKDRIVDNRALSGMSKVLRTARANVTGYTLGGRPSTLLMQPLGMFNGMQELRKRVPNWKKYYGRAQRKAWGGFNPKRMQAVYEEISKVSGEMRNRIGQIDRDQRDIIRRAMLKSGVEDTAKRAAMEFIGKMQMYTVDIPIWLCAYEGGVMELEMTPQEAVNFADSIVRMSQGGGGPKDLSEIQRSEEGIRQLLLFFSWRNTLYNQRRSDLVALNEGRKIKDVGAFLAASAFRVVIPAIGAALVHGDFWDDDEASSWLKIGRSYLNEELGTIPYMEWSGFIQLLLGGHRFFGVDTPISRTGDTIIDAGSSLKDVATGDIGALDELFINSLRVYGITKGMPLGYATKEFEDLMKEE